MKKLLLLLVFLSLSGTRLLAGGWGTAPPTAAVCNTSISGATAWGTAGSTASFLMAWYQDPPPSNAWHCLGMMYSNGANLRIPRTPHTYATVPSFTVSMTGYYTLAISSSASSSTIGSPTGSLQVQQ